MAEKKETAQERLERMKREKEAAKTESTEKGIVDQLTHEGDGSQDFSDLAQKLKERKELEAKGENHGYQKLTIYIRDDIAESFSALCTKRGQQKEYANIALADFVKKKAKELGL